MVNLTTLAMIAILAGVGTLSTMGFSAYNSAVAQTMMDNATMVGNMTGGNMTGGNMTGGNMTGGNMTDMEGTISTRYRSCNELC